MPLNPNSSGSKDYSVAGKTNSHLSSIIGEAGVKMNRNPIKNILVGTVLLMVLTSIPIISAGCQEDSPLPSTASGKLSSTLVPNIDVDVYVYFKQENPTTIPKGLIGTPLDLEVESLALWSIPTEDKFILGGGLTLTSTDDAAKIQVQIPGNGETWTMLSGRIIYFVRGSGVIAEDMKAAISRNDFKYYDDQKALAEVALLPDSGTTKIAAVGIIIPSETLIKLIMNNIAPESSDMINSFVPWARLQVIAGGLYALHEIDIARILQTIELGGTWESDLGILALVKSGVPGFVATPIVQKLLSNAGFTEIKLGELTLYKGSLDTGKGKTIPVLVRIEGNRIFAAISGQESYAQTLITSISS